MNTTDKFEGKVLNALDKLEDEGKIVGLVDPMAFDSEEELETKKRIWRDIFDRNPDLSNLIISIYADLGDDGLYEYLFTFIRDNFGAWYQEVTKSEAKNAD